MSSPHVSLAPSCKVLASQVNNASAFLTCTVFLTTRNAQRNSHAVACAYTSHHLLIVHWRIISRTQLPIIAFSSRSNLHAAYRPALQPLLHFTPGFHDSSYASPQAFHARSRKADPSYSRLLDSRTTVRLTLSAWNAEPHPPPTRTTSQEHLSVSGFVQTHTLLHFTHAPPLPSR